ncbi:hypothetical protein ABZ260_15315 [Streptosporangium sp. NPDC006013]|uniref:hypothetical protein n=1 Tax=Streptosporangium sp. NPDC006013 TaxID=3155596 RepID=UPI0033BE4C2A
MVGETEGIRLVKEPGEAGHSAEFFGLDGAGEQGRTAPAGRLDVLVNDAGTGLGESEPGVLLALAGVNEISCVIVGHDRRARASRPRGTGVPHEARRGMRLAEDPGLPVVMVIDTPGAAGAARVVRRARADPWPEDAPGSGHRWHQVVSIASMTAPSSVRT